MIFVDLTGLHLSEAENFADAMYDSTTFVHFRHTRPAQMLDRNKWLVRMLLDETRCIGWGHAQVFPNPKEHVARIGLAVLPVWWGKGIGQRIIEHLVQNLQQKRKLTASIYADNEPSLRLFRSNGFHEEGVFVAEERWDGIDRSIMSFARFL